LRSDFFSSDVSSSYHFFIEKSEAGIVDYIIAIKRIWDEGGVIKAWFIL
jgi:hypothetical protein